MNLHEHYFDICIYQMSLLDVEIPGLNMSSNTSLEELYALYDNSSKYQTNNIILIILYVPVFLIAVLGNIVILLAILTDVRLRRSSANYFLVNLAIADLLSKLCFVSSVCRARAGILSVRLEGCNNI